MEPEVVHPGEWVSIRELEDDPMIREQRRAGGRTARGRRRCRARVRRRPRPPGRPCPRPRASAPWTATAETPAARAFARKPSSMSSCASTPTRVPARPASGRDVAPPPHPTSSTRPASGSRSSALACRRCRPSRSAPCAPRARKSSVGNPHGDSGAAARISGGIAQLSSSSRHRSTAVTARARTSSVCSPRSGGGNRVSSSVPSNRIGFRTSRSVVAATRVGHLFDHRGALGRGEHLVDRPDRSGGDRRGLERSDPLGGGLRSRTTRRGAGSARLDAAPDPRSSRSG